MAERKLGRGLDALLGEPGAAARGEEVANLPVDQIEAGPHQPRQDFDEKQLGELASSIRENGILQPVIVRPGGSRGYQIVAGERRVRAAQAAGLTEIPVIVRDYSDDDVLVLSLVENVQRADLNPIDKAAAYRRLVKHLGVTQDVVAKRLGLDRATVSNMIRLLELPEEVRDLVRKRALTMGHARALLALEHETDQLDMTARIVREGLSVRAVEESIRSGGAARAQPKRRTNPRKTPQVMALESELRALLGTKVQIRDRRGKGRIVIEYFSPSEFERIVGQIRSERGFSAT